MKAPIALNVSVASMHALPAKADFGKDRATQAVVPEYQFLNLLLQAQGKGQTEADQSGGQGVPASAQEPEGKATQTVGVSGAQPDPGALLNIPPSSAVPRILPQAQTAAAPGKETIPGTNEKSAFSAGGEKKTKASAAKPFPGVPPSAVVVPLDLTQGTQAPPPLPGSPVILSPPAPSPAALAAHGKMPAVAARTQPVLQPVGPAQDASVSGAVETQPLALSAEKQPADGAPQSAAAKPEPGAAAASGQEAASNATAVASGQGSVAGNSASNALPGSAPDKSSGSSTAGGDTVAVAGWAGTAQDGSVGMAATVHDSGAASMPGAGHEAPPIAPAQGAARDIPSLTPQADASARSTPPAATGGSANPHAILDAAGAQSGGRETVWQVTPNRVEAGFHNAQNSWVSVVAQRQDGHLTATLESASAAERGALQTLLPQLSHHLADRQVQLNQLGVSVRQQFSPGGEAGGGDQGQAQSWTRGEQPAERLRQAGSASVQAEAANPVSLEAGAISLRA